MFEGTADRMVGEDTWAFTIEEILFQDDVVATTDGRRLQVSPRTVGDSIRVEVPDDQIRAGASYVVAGAQGSFGDPDSVETGRALFDAQTMEPLVSGPPDLKALAPAGATPAILKRTLVKYLAEASEYNDSARAGFDSPPVGETLERAWVLQGKAPVALSSDPDSEELELYLAASPDVRQLEPLADLPAGAADVLGLRDFWALVVWVPGDVDARYDAIGFKTEVGYLGPQMLGTSWAFTEVVGSIPSDGTVELVGWAADSAPRFEFTSAVSIPLPGSIDLTGAGEVLLVDLASSHVGWISETEARARVQELLGVAG